MGKKKKGDLKPEDLEEAAMIAGERAMQRLLKKYSTKNDPAEEEIEAKEGGESLKEATGFGSAPNLDQDEFDKTQENLSDEQLEDQVSGLVELFRRKQQEDLEKKE